MISVRVGAERHADSYLVDAPRHGVGQQSVQAKGCEHRAQRAEQPGQHGAEAFGNDGAIHLAGQRRHLLDGHGL